MRMRIYILLRKRNILDIARLYGTVQCAKDKHMPKQMVKYNKKKHKKTKWMTQAILN